MATYTATAITRAAVDAQVALGFGPGDTLVFPTGTVSPTDYIFDANFPCTVQGAGKYLTNITPNVSSGNAVFHINAANVTIRDIGFTDMVQDKDAIYAHATALDFRVTNNYFQSGYLSGALVIRAYEARGVFDNNITIGSRVNGENQTLALTAHPVFFGASKIGTANTVFIENNDMTGVGPNIVDGNYGFHFVFRYNTVTNGALECHSTQSHNSRGTKNWEIYKNHFIATEARNYPWFIRGGTGVGWGNRFSTSGAGSWGANIGGVVNNVRSSELRGDCKHASGGSPYYDGDTASFTGTHTGGTSATLTDSGASWTVDALRTATIRTGTHTGSNGQQNIADSARPAGFEPGAFSFSEAGGVDIGYIVRNTTDGSWCKASGQGTNTLACTVLQGGTNNVWNTGNAYAIHCGDWIVNVTDGSRSCIVSNGTTTVVGPLEGGSDNQWENGDTYKVVYGYPARDQIGRGPDVSLNTGYGIVSNPSNPWSAQSLEPAYFWDNRIGADINDSSGAHQNVMISGGINSSRHIVDGRDYYSNTQRPGYTPYTYPHPLNVGSASATPQPRRRSGFGVVGPI